MGHIRSYEFFDNCGKSNTRNRKAAELELGWTIFENSDKFELGYGYGAYPTQCRMRAMARYWVTWVDRKQPFETVSAAKEWLDEHVDYGAKVVPVKVSKAAQESAATKKLAEREVAAQARISKLAAELRVQNRRSDSVTCDKCRSRIALAYYKGEIKGSVQPCPVCGRNLLSASSVSRLTAARDNLSAVSKQLRESRKADEGRAAKGGKVRWLALWDAHC